LGHLGVGVSVGARHAVPIFPGHLSVVDSPLQQARLLFTTPEEVVGVAQDFSRHVPAEGYPHLAELVVQRVLRPGYGYADEFAFGLDLILDGLVRIRDTVLSNRGAQ
jgi:hypothetical protein